MCGCGLGRLFLLPRCSDFLDGGASSATGSEDAEAVAFTVDAKHDADATDGNDVAGFTDDAGHDSVAGCRNFTVALSVITDRMGSSLDGVTDGDHPLNDFTFNDTFTDVRQLKLKFSHVHSSCVLCMASAMRDGLGR